MTSRAHSVPANTTDTAEKLVIGEGLIRRTHLDGRVGLRYDIELTREVWQHAHVGDRVIVETDAGDMHTATLELGDDDMPIVQLVAAPEGNARRATVRHPRSGS